MAYRILVITYSQTGQTNAIAEALLQGFGSDCEVKYVQIEPEKKYPFPWNGRAFFDAMPETVLEVPIALKPVDLAPAEKFDLILLGWQPWFLSVNRPILSFMRSEQGRRLLKDTPVVTFLGCRNMWVSANEKMKRYLAEAGARHVGQIAMVNHSANLVSLITILAWMLRGIKENFMGIFPSGGIDASYYRSSPRMGEAIYKALKTADWEELQPQLLALGAMQIKPKLILMEKTGSQRFIFFARWISAKGGEGDPNRVSRVIFFSWFLPFMIVLLTPLITLLRPLQILLKRKALRREAEYLVQLPFEKGRFHPSDNNM